MENANKNIKKFESKKQMKKKKIKKIRFFVISIFLLIVCVLLYTLPVFKLKSIDVIGNNYYQKEQIIDASNLLLNSNIFGQAMFGKVKSIYELPYIDKVKLHIKFPNDIVIEVEERKSLFYAYDKENKVYYRISDEGYILEKAEKRNEEEIILIGITFDEDVKFGSKINEIDMQKLYIYEQIYNEYTSSSMTGKITKVSFENSLTTITINDKLSVIFPNLTNLKYNMALLKGIIKNIGEDSSGIIDLNKENPTYSNF